jgi:hypothetical protein
MKICAFVIVALAGVSYSISVQAQKTVEEKEEGGKTPPGGIVEAGPTEGGEESKVEEQTEEESPEEKVKEKEEDKERKAMELKLFMGNLAKMLVKKCQKFAAAERMIALDMSISSSGHVEHLEVSGSLSLAELDCVQFIVSNSIFPSADYNYKIKYTVTMPSSQAPAAVTVPVGVEPTVEPVESAAREPARPEETGWPGYATKGNVEIGGGLEFYFQRSSFETDRRPAGETEIDSYRLVFSPSVSYFIANIFAFGVGIKTIFDKVGETNNFSFLFYISPALVARLGPSAFFFFDVVLGAAACRPDFEGSGETRVQTHTGGLFHVGALFGLAVSVSRNIVIKTGPAVTYEIGKVSDGADFKAQNILAGFSMGFSFYIPTKKSFREAGKKHRSANP